MLHDFIARHRTELLAECVRELRDRYPNRTDCELIGKLDCFIDELTIALAHDATAPLATTSLGNPGAASGREHGITRRMQGFDLNRVVHDFGLVCEISTSTAIRYDERVEVREFQVMNRCIDEGIAAAVDSFAAHSKKQAEHIGFAAHEIRNAANNALLGFELIRRGTAASNGATGNAVHRALSLIGSLVSGTLTEARLEANAVAERQEIKLVDLLQQMIVGMPTERGVELKLDVAEGLIIDADAVLLNSALSNLAQNAIKFTRDNTTVEIRAREMNQTVIIEVEDRCGGLSPEVMDQLFQPFVQKTRDQRGSGLGLAIARRAVEAHGGTLTCRDIPTIGCIFETLLPRTNRFIDQA